jgi:CIC family chloride channel protein
LQRLPHWTQYFQPAIAGFAIGVIGIRAPQVLGAGYPIIDWALHDQFTWNVLVALAICKIVATGLSFVSGTPGGLFAPTLFIGAMLGGAVGGVEHLLFHQITGSVGAFALVGMGTLFAGFLRIPITSVFMVIEVSGSYSAIVPVMISNTIAYLISRQYQRSSLFDMLSQQDGIDLPSIEEQREQAVLRVENAMQRVAGNAEQRDEIFAQALKRAGVAPDGYFLSLDRAGWRVCRRKPSGIADENSTGEGAPVAPEAVETSPYLYPDETLEEALRSFGDWPVLPVISRADFYKLGGLITLPDVLRAYRSE